MRDLFLSVGAMKAGTTFIYNILRQHPAIYFTPEKELHYFANIYGLDNGLSSPICFSPANHSLKLLKRKKHNRLQGEILSADFRRLRLSSVLKGKFSKLGDADELRQVVLWYTDRYMSDPIDEAWFSRVFADAGDRYLADFSNYHALLDKNAWQDIRKNTPGKLRCFTFSAILWTDCGLTTNFITSNRARMRPLMNFLLQTPRRY